MGMSQLAAELGLGVAFSMIALAPMLKTERNPNSNMKVDIVVGLPGTSENMGGAIPNVALFDAKGARLGFWVNNHDGRNLNKDNQKDVPAGAVMDGGTGQVNVDYLVGGDTRKPEYITVSASGFDAVCIMEVVVKHPVSEEHFTFLPGEVAKQCTGGWSDGDTVIWSEQATQVTFELNGEQARSRPKCLWIDNADPDHHAPMTKWKGFGVHLPDFAVDNTTFAVWEKDPWQMCSSKARFGLYEKINEAMCPPVFVKPPSNGARLPMEELPGCSPGLVAGPGGTVYEDFCNDPELSPEERKTLSDAYDGRCETKQDRLDKFKEPFGGHGCKRSPRASCAKKRAEEDLDAGVKKIQARFQGQLVKSRDSGQSAIKLCNSKGSVGANFFSYPENTFCDMSTKKSFPGCEDDDATECFDV